jgi:hypothetical protein
MDKKISAPNFVAGGDGELHLDGPGTVLLGGQRLGLGVVAFGHFQPLEEA